MAQDMAACLVVSAHAEQFVEEIQRLAESPVPVKAASSAADALAAYSDETVVFGDPQMIAGVLPRMPTVDWVQSSWAGVKPLIDDGRRDYVLTGVKGVFGPQMSEYVFGYLLAHELRIAERSRQQTAHHWYREQSGVLDGKTIGIMGTGSIGAYIAGTARAFNMRTLGLNRSGSRATGFDAVWPVAELQAFLSRVDYLVSTLPETPETAGLLNPGSLALLPERAYFINVGRSNVVDDLALVDALAAGRLAGAALDVFDVEPLPGESPLWDAPNLSVTAHVAAISHPLLIVPVFVENYERYRRGEPLRYVIDFAAGY
jgi:phosphoglycerate dehydrogenase-like enzyme